MKQLEIWYYNPNKKNVVLAELDMTIKAHTYVNLLKHNPSLTLIRILNSEASGILYRYVNSGKLIKVDKPIAKPVSEYRYTESKQPIYGKNYSVVLIDPKEKGFIDQLESDFIDDVIADESKQVAINEKFLKTVDLDGFSDPLKDLLE